MRFAAAALAAVVLSALAGCASTTVTLDPAPQAAVCRASGRALVVWAPRWRVDQKDVAGREAAAAAGLREFLARSACFAEADVRQAGDVAPSTVRSILGDPPGRYAQIVGIEVRELGPILKLLSSAALVEGGTEVVLRIVEFAAPAAIERRQFIVHWRNAGPGVVRGVAGLAEDMQAALHAGLQPGGSAR